METSSSLTVGRPRSPTLQWLAANTNVPNVITAIRSLILPFGLAALCADYYTLGLLLFIAIAAGDGLDGWLARRLKQETGFGKIFDSFMDKVSMLAYQYVLLVFPGLIDFFWLPQRWLFLVSFFLEMVLVLSRVEKYKKSFGFVGNDAAKKPGKYKMWCQCLFAGFAILSLLINRSWALIVAEVLFGLSIPFIVWSIIARLRAQVWRVRVARFMASL